MSAPITTFLQRKDFPEDFTIGAASSAFQVEGAAREGGRGPSIWDTFCEKKGWQVGEAIDHFRRYKEDVAMMKWIGLDTYRFSISWSRIMPDGVNVNFEGIKFYHELIGELRRNGITPFVTLFHWDIPQALEDKYGGFRSEKIVADFENYADTCFKFFGSDVKNWITLNEPWSFTEGGYASGNHAPGRGYQGESNFPTDGKPPRYPRGATEPYLVTHYQLLAHARAVQIYRERYNRSKDGQIGIALNSVWFAPATDSEKDKKAAERAFDFTLNWFLYPITKGEYPQGMAKIMKDRKLPYKFSRKSCVKDSMDFLGINYYIACYVRDKPDIEKEHGENFTTDYNTEYPPEPSLGEEFPGSVGWLKVYPQGLKDLMFRIKKEYPGPIYITENGYGENNDDNLPHHEALHDNHRLYYIHHHLSQISEITKEDAPNKVNVKGYFAWTLWDNFEWAGRFDIRFGNIYVDYKNNLERTPKFSAHWLKYVLWREPRKKGPGLIDTGNEPTTRSSSRRSTSMSSVSSRSSSMSSTKKVHPATSVTTRTRLDPGLGMSPVRSTPAQSQNCGLTTRTSSLSQCALESEPESEEENESDNSDDITNSSELESGLENEEDFESDNDSDPARGASDNSNESEDVTSFPARCYTKASIKCSGRKY